MAAYGGLLSLMNLMEQTKHYRGRNQIFDDEQLNTLHEKVSFLQKFLEDYPVKNSNFLQKFLEDYPVKNSNEADILERQIVDAVYAAEDLIESHIVDDIRIRTTNNTGDKLSSDYFSQQLHKVIKDMDVIRMEAIKIAEKAEISNETTRLDLLSAGSYGPPTGMMEDCLVGLDESLFRVKNMLTSYEHDRQIIAITGIVGIGKTALARCVFNDSRIKGHFDIQGWVTISQEVDSRSIVLSLLRDMGIVVHQTDDFRDLGDKLYKNLFGRRYLIVVDDIWSVKTWDMLRRFLPAYGTGSRILITTRILSLASQISTIQPYQMRFLDENESWTLLQRRVFGQERCPHGLEEIGRRIARSCSGLPLAIFFVGGILAKSSMQQYSWESIAKAIDTGSQLDVDDHASLILHVSYSQLPVHLKPCFLYLGVFQKEHSIRVSKIKKLWVAEGFLKPREGRMLEEVAVDYLKDLIGRSLIDVDVIGSNGNVKFCKVHNLVRDLCLREAKRLNFFNVTKAQNPDISQALNSQRRVVLLSNKSEELHSPELDRALQSSSFVRSFVCNFQYTSKPSFDAKLLRVWSAEKSYRSKVLSELVNSRYLDFGFGGKCYRFPSSMCLLWNLQTITLGLQDTAILPSTIWEMSELRHVNIEVFECADPRGDNNIVLQKLQTLSKILDFRCSEVVVRIIPNVRKLKVSYQDGMLLPEYLQNIGRLEKLKSLYCRFGYRFPRMVMSRLELPYSLVKLTLLVGEFNWEDMGKKIGLLPHLQKLKLYAFQGGNEWYLREGLFCSVRFLHIATLGLQVWYTDGGIVLPCLEHLRLEQLIKLERIPIEIGEIQTLQTISLYDCSKSAVESANERLEEQRDMGNEDIVVNIYTNGE